jgi:uncharacterized protein
MVIADTGFWLALANRKDRMHHRAQEALRALDEPLITTLPVMTEASHLLLGALGTPALLSFVAAWRDGAFQVFELGAAHAARVEALMRKHADLPMDLADASLVVLAESLGHGRILSTDARDFGAYRYKHHHPFQNLLA